MMLLIKKHKTFISSITLSQGILVDFILGKIECFTSNKINGFNDKTPKTFISSTTLFRGILVDFILGKLGCFTNNKINGLLIKYSRHLLLQQLCLTKSWWTLH
jgi:hypothetical protein